MYKIIDGVLQGGGQESRKNVVPEDKIHKANDFDAVDYTWTTYPDSLRRKIKVAIAKKLKPEAILEEVFQAAEKNPSEDNKVILIQFLNELNRAPENEKMVEEILVSNRFYKLKLKGGN